MAAVKIGSRNQSFEPTNAQLLCVIFVFFSFTVLFFKVCQWCICSYKSHSRRGLLSRHNCFGKAAVGVRHPQRPVRILSYSLILR